MSEGVSACGVGPLEAQYLALAVFELIVEGEAVAVARLDDLVRL